MTPARSQLESVVDALRRKQLIAIAFTAFVEMALVGAIVYALLRIGLPNIVLSKPRRIVLAFALLLVFFAALMLEQARQAHSLLFLAKRIDSANELDDHLVSALSFDDPPVSGFEVACINALILRLQDVRVRIPDVRLQRVWLIIPALLITGVTGAVEYKRRTKPDDDGSIKIALPADLRERVRSLETVEASAAKIDPALAKRATETRAMLDKLIDRQTTKESVLRDLSTAREALGQYEASNPTLIDAAMQLGDPSTQRASNLLGAVRAGKAAAVSEALRTVADALSGKKPPPLSNEERAEVAAILEALAQATHAAQLSKQLNDAGQAVRERPTGPEAARPVEALQAPLAEQLSREAATRQLTNSIRAALADAGHQAELAARKLSPVIGSPTEAPTDGGTAGTGGAGAGATGETDPTEEQGGEGGGAATGGAGAGTSAEPNYAGGRPELPETGTDQRLTAPWVGAPVRQLVAAGSSNDPGAQAAARAILTAQQRQLEREVRREEIPAEYATSIRRYFSNIQRSWEREWKPSK